ncbi:hypothetical protein CK218_22250 [Mesorhizobium sp. WSM3879]|uniref:hypothetical protein n=1 Tax=Mesorhizobium sp. WSM3879 TaxID=2029406 RepID=UPI000BB05666|nr:hypothetical protein [Mesorhizobium sp. WSM3879]PBB79074.1 hypothetical protein CK218_22250 [Mesorhizobium sp. WSM3879]
MTIKPRKTPMSRAPRDRADVDAIGRKLFGAKWDKHRAALDREAEKRRKRNQKQDDGDGC